MKIRFLNLVCAVLVFFSATAARGAEPAPIDGISDNSFLIEEAYNPKYRYLLDKTDREAILKAFEPMVSQREQAGMGLTEIKEAILEEKGSLLLSSNTGYFAIREGKTWCGQIQFNLPGVQMEIKLPERN